MENEKLERIGYINSEIDYFEVVSPIKYANDYTLLIGRDKQNPKDLLLIKHKDSVNYLRCYDLYRKISPALAEKLLMRENKNQLNSLDNAMFANITLGNYEKVKECLNKGANVNAKTKYNNNALIIAVAHHHTKIAELLIERDAHIRAKNDRGDSALSLVKEYSYNCNETKNLIEKYANKPQISKKVKPKAKESILNMRGM